MNNVVLVTVDSLRADSCGFLGGTDLTPALDTLAAEGLAFENAIAPGPSTYESLPSLFTGRLQCDYPVAGDTFERRHRLLRLNTRRRTIPEWFADQGYATAAFTTNPYTSAHTNFARGFDRYEDFLDGGEGPISRAAGHLPVVGELVNLLTVVRGNRAAKPWQSFYEAIVQWVDAATEPYFLWVFLLDSHTPYLPPAEYRPFGRLRTYYHNGRLWGRKKWHLDHAPDATALRRLYAGTVRSVDEFIGRLRGDLPGEPVLAVHSDHGESFGEHGQYGHGPQLYEENVHVPLVVVGGGLPHRTVAAPTSLTSLPALLSGAARNDVSVPDAPFAVCRTLGSEKVAVRWRAWKYIAEVSTPPDRTGRVETGALYDLGTDPGEALDRSPTHPEATAVGRSIVERRLAHEREVRRSYETARRLVDST